MEWQRGVNWLHGIWVGFQSSFLGVLDSFIYGGQLLWAEFVAGVARMWEGLMLTLRQGWTTFASWHRQQVINLSDWMAYRWADIQAALDENFDKELAYRIIREDSQRERRANEGEYQRRLTANERGHRQTLADIEAARSERVDEIAHADAENARRRRIDEQRQLAATAQALAQARQEWRDALEAARQTRAAHKGAVEGPEALAGPEGLLNQLYEQATAARSSLGSAASQGTFNAASALGLQSLGGPMDRMADGIEAIEDNTRRLLDEARNGGLEFAG